MKRGTLGPRSSLFLNRTPKKKKSREDISRLLSRKNTHTRRRKENGSRGKRKGTSFPPVSEQTQHLSSQIVRQRKPSETWARAEEWSRAASPREAQSQRRRMATIREKDDDKQQQWQQAAPARAAATPGRASRCSSCLPPPSSAIQLSQHFDRPDTE